MHAPIHVPQSAIGPALVGTSIALWGLSSALPDSPHADAEMDLTDTETDA